jgi:ribosomal protein S18 acetylase RimI-like enzyme
MKNNRIESWKHFLVENSLLETEKIFTVNDNKFELFLGDVLVVESGFNVEPADKWFREKYVSIYSLKTVEEFQGKGLAKYLLLQIFDYVKNKLGISIITLIVDKDNSKAVNLYFNTGFKTLIEYDDSFSLIKKL